MNAMQAGFKIKNYGAFCVMLLSALAAAQEAPATPASEARAEETSGLPARAAPGDYQANKQVGSFTIAAEFTGHSIPTPQALYTTEDYVAVEVAFFGSPDARLKLSADDFSIRINGKKTPSPAQPYALTFSSLKDPEWEPPEPAGGKESKSKGGLSAGGGGGNGDPPPSPPKMPIELKRVMQGRVQKSVLREGVRALPEAGFLYFQYGGKVKGIRTVELIYHGPAGDAVLALQP